MAKKKAKTKEAAIINGIAVDFGPPGGLGETSLRTLELSPEQLALANANQEVVLTLTLGAIPGGGGDIIAFDFYQLNGNLANDEPPVSVPEPGSLMTLFGLGIVVLFHRFRRLRVALLRRLLVSIGERA